MRLVKHLLADKGPEIYVIGPDQPVLEAIRLMAEKHVGALLVMRAEELLGVVSERDYARKVILKGRASADTPVREIMTAPVTRVALNDTVNTCMMLMTDGRFRHLPVVDGERVVGMLSIGDLVKAVIEEQQKEIAQLERYIAG